jgi:hypothetical protein
VAWSRVRDELIFETADGHIMVAQYAVRDDAFMPSDPKPWAEVPHLLRQRFGSIDLHPDGLRIAMAPVPEPTATKQDKVVFVFGFFDELRRRAPAR